MQGWTRLDKFGAGEGVVDGVESSRAVSQSRSPAVSQSRKLFEGLLSPVSGFSWFSSSTFLPAEIGAGLSSPRFLHHGTQCARSVHAVKVNQAQKYRECIAVNREDRCSCRRCSKEQEPLQKKRAGSNTPGPPNDQTPEARLGRTYGVAFDGVSAGGGVPRAGESREEPVHCPAGVKFFWQRVQESFGFLLDFLLRKCSNHGSGGETYVIPGSGFAARSVSTCSGFPNTSKPSVL